MGAPATSTAATTTDDGVRLRAMTAADLSAAHALSDMVRWPHRPIDWEQAFRHAEGVIAECDGEVVGSLYAIVTQAIG